MTDLSPAAQALHHAALYAGPKLEARIAAALRAAADQVVPEHPTRPAWTHVEQVRRELLAIAAELEGQL